MGAVMKHPLVEIKRVALESSLASPLEKQFPDGHPLRHLLVVAGGANGRRLTQKGFTWLISVVSLGLLSPESNSWACSNSIATLTGSFWLANTVPWALVSTTTTSLGFSFTGPCGVHVTNMAVGRKCLRTICR